MKRVVFFLLALFVSMACAVSAPVEKQSTGYGHTYRSGRSIKLLVKQQPVEFTVTGTVYIRSASGERIGYKERGDVVTCEIIDNYCVLPDTTRVWSGCLDPNPLNLGCRER